MNEFRRALFGLPLLCLVLLTGCATPQPPVPMDQSFWAQKQERIGIAYTQVPKPTVIMAGQQGLLDMAVNNGLAAGLRSKVETWDSSSLRSIPAQVGEQLRADGYQAVNIDDPLVLDTLAKNKAEKTGYASKDFQPLKSQKQIDKLVLFEFGSAGTMRTYYGMVPTSVPVAQVVVTTYVIDLNDNHLLYYQPNVFSHSADGEWDEAPDFPNLTNAFYQALDSTQQSLLGVFRNQQLSAARP
ncbi:hypothetical protein [Pseudomonas schmalbachii]|uniref:Lipoprotein n=1 Tax=Pseudomonas schmalbachii TaxID=2816993 RepID=A0ABS3TTC4_9PSED|nr:hypothetical protein [Pseudomonas schmalbachii]MBO3276888.1 hypothetical protein [Pseudomonas schmalbachii]